MSCIDSFLMHFPLASRPLKLAQTSIWWSGFCISSSYLKTEILKLSAKKIFLHHQFEGFLGGIPVFAVQERIEYFFEQAYSPHVPHSGKVAVPYAVEDREAEPDKRDVLVPRDVL